MLPPPNTKGRVNHCPTFWPPSQSLCPSYLSKPCIGFVSWTNGCLGVGRGTDKDDEVHWVPLWIFRAPLLRLWRVYWGYFFYYYQILLPLITNEIPSHGWYTPHKNHGEDCWVLNASEDFYCNQFSVVKVDFTTNPTSTMWLFVETFTLLYDATCFRRRCYYYYACCWITK